MASTPVKKHHSENCLCRLCNKVFKNNPIDLFTAKAKEERMTVFFETFFGAKISVDDSYHYRLQDHQLSRICCYEIHSKEQQETVVGAKGGKSVAVSPSHR